MAVWSRVAEEEISISCAARSGNPLRESAMRITLDA
jgi:hypothetical protein